MKIDFKQQFGVNAGYVEGLFEQWRENPSSVDEEWGLWFSSIAAEHGTKVSSSSVGEVAEPASTEDVDVAPLRGIAASIAKNMNACALLRASPGGVISATRGKLLPLS